MMTTDNQQVRLAEQQNSKRIWEIRNDPKVRVVSGNSEAFSFESHDSWFTQKYFSGQDNQCYVLEISGQVQGYCRLDWDDDKQWYIISIALDPAVHGQGLGTYLLQETLKQFGSKGKVLAEIKKSNKPSIKLFTKSGFKVFDEDQDNVYLQYER